ncbi:MAG TPA: D-alanyl-D-alanine carboxypeptidase [Microbacteriaceae bacterium]|nr:D-alanyl-D-alanine carboxypeptidase [Microbacteriaceae bacterium]
MRDTARGPRSRFGRLAAIVLAAGLGLTACAGTGWPGSPGSTGPTASPAGDDLTAAVEAFTTAPRFANSAWSILAVDRATGEEVLAVNPTAPLVPGSIMKNFTTATALELLGADRRVTTTVHGLGELRDGVLAGGLALVGAGDFSFGLRDEPDGTLWVGGFDHNEANTGLFAPDLPPGDPLAGLRDLAGQLTAAGVTRIAGDVVVDNRRFDPEHRWPDGRIDSIWVNENLIDALLTPGTVGTSPVVELRPALRGLELVNEARTVAGDGVDLLVEDLGDLRVRVSGTIGVDAGLTVRGAQIGDPAEFARRAFLEILGEAGIPVDGTAATNPVESLPAPGGYLGVPLASRDSATTAEFAKVILKISYNRGADLLGCLLAVDAGSTDCRDGLRIILDTITTLGTPDGAAFVFDPAGTDDNDRSSAAAQVGLLLGAGTRPWGEVWHAAMPISGVDGSLASLGAGTASDGMIQAKTGSRIIEYPATGGLVYLAQSYAGYLTTASGRDLAFAIIVNGIRVDTFDGLFPVMDEIAELPLILQRLG